MANQKISQFDDYGVPDSDVIFYSLFDGTDDYQVNASDVRRDAYELITATGSRTINAQAYIELSSASQIILTISGAPTVGDTLEIYRVGTGGVTHEIQLSGSVTFDGTNNTALFDADADYIRLKAISATRWRILQNTGVTFS